MPLTPTAPVTEVRFSAELAWTRTLPSAVDRGRRDIRLRVLGDRVDVDARAQAGVASAGERTGRC